MTGVTGLLGLITAVALMLAQPTSPSWTLVPSGVTTRLRGVSVVDARVAWASGADGTILRSLDGGTHWQPRPIPGTGGLDFRDIDALSADVAWALSMGAGALSRIYKTTDGGQSWTLQFVADEPEAFFDAMAFWDADRGVAFGDSARGRFHVLTTTDGGRAWRRVPADALPPALDNEGAFAASGSIVVTHPPGHVWIGTGAAATARVLASHDAGRTWTVADTPLVAGPTAGIFSIVFHSPGHGIVVGGDYTREDDVRRSAAVTDDGGRTWGLVEGLTGFRSAVQVVPEGGPRGGAPGRPRLVAVGPSGGDVSRDGGHTWRPLAGPGFHALGASPDGQLVVGVGEGGRIGVLR